MDSSTGDHPFDQAQDRPFDQAQDRLSLALFLAALVHALAILGVSFSLPDRPRYAKPLEITLTHNTAEQPPQRADFLAADNQIGGGRGKAVPQANSIPLASGQPASGRPAAEHAAASRQETVLVRPKAPHKSVLSRPGVSKPVLSVVVRDGGTAVPAEETHHTEAPRIDLALVQQQISEFSAEFVQAQEKYAKQSNILYINSVSAHKYVAAAYEKAWQDKIERVGNLNYPDEARRKSLSGGLLLSVAIGKDGKIHSIKVRQPSGQAVLDDAATRIVQLAAPFAPFPPGLSEEADVLVITRTWRFFSDAHLSTAP